jgi:hypothetical protein
MAKWETQAGLPTRGLMYSQMLEHLRQAQENACMLAHLQQTEDGVKDSALAAGWLSIAELFRRVELQVTKLAQGRLN